MTCHKSNLLTPSKYDVVTTSETSLKERQSIRSEEKNTVAAMDFCSTIRLVNWVAECPTQPLGKLDDQRNHWVGDR